MNPAYYLRLTEGLELLTFCVLQPSLALAIAYRAWRERPENLSRYKVPCLVSGATAVLLILFVRWLNADVRTFVYFLQVACFVAGFLLFGVCMGCGFAVLLSVWHWHKRTRLS